MSSPEGSISPASDTAEKLENLNSSTGAIIDAFSEIIALPYVDSLKIDDAGIISVSDLALELKENYQNLQGETLPFARDLFSYATLQISTIPLINNGDLTLQNYILLNKSVIARKKTNATKIKDISESYHKQFVIAVETLNETLGKLKNQIEELRSEIEEKKGAYNDAVVGAVFAAVLAGLFTAGFVAGLFATGGALAGAAAANGCIAAMGASLAGVAGTSGLVGVTGAAGLGAASAIVTTIVKSVEAGNILGAIHTLETALKTAETTSDNLEEVVHKMQAVEDKLDDIVGIWTEVEDSLDLVLGDITAWETPGFFTTEKGNETVEEWTTVRDAVSKYTEIVSSRSVAPPVFSSFAVDKKIDNAGINATMFLQSVNIMVMNDLKESLIAPRVEIDGQLSDINDAQKVLLQIIAQPLLQTERQITSNALKCTEFLVTASDSMGTSCSRLASMSLYSHSLYKKLFEYDASQIGNVSEQVRKSLEAQIMSVDSQHATASDEISASEQAVFSFQHSYLLLQSSLEQLYGEKLAQKSVLQKQLNDIEQDRKNRKFLWLVPLAGAINELVDLANDIQGKINTIRRETREIAALLKILKSISGAVLHSSKQTTQMSHVFSEILSKNEELKASLDLVEQLKLDTPAVFFRDIAVSWDNLHDELIWFCR